MPDTIPFKIQRGERRALPQHPGYSKQFDCSFKRVMVIDWAGGTVDVRSWALLSTECRLWRVNSSYNAPKSSYNAPKTFVNPCTGMDPKPKPAFGTPAIRRYSSLQDFFSLEHAVHMRRTCEYTETEILS